MNITAKIALGTAATGAVLLVAITPALATTGTASNMAVVTPPSVSATALAATPPVTNAPPPAAHIGAKEWFPEATRSVAVALPHTQIGTRYFPVGPCPNPEG